MKTKTFVDTFFANVDTSLYSVYDNRDGRRAVDFGYKQLHEGHLAKLYEWALSHNAELSTADFANLVPGRPCASVPFFETCTRAKLCVFAHKHRNTKVYHFKV
jgi:hypothetical protein